MKLDIYEYILIALVISLLVYIAFFSKPAEGPQCSYYKSDTANGSVKIQICEKK